MAQISRGKRKGEMVTISQMANDWISLSDGTIINPTSLYFTGEEMGRLIQDKNPGMFWDIYRVTIKNVPEPYFKLIKRKYKD